MILPRNTVCTKFELGSPIWGGGKRVVGLNKTRITKHNEIEFTYISKKTGKRSMMDHYYFDGDRRGTEEFPEQVVRGGVTLLLVPLDSLPTLTREEPPKVQWITDPEKMPKAIRETFFEDQIKLL